MDFHISTNDGRSKIEGRRELVTFLEMATLGAYFALISRRICASASSLQYLQLSCRKTEV